MTINLKDYTGKLVVATLRNDLIVVGRVNISEKYHNIPYVIYDRHYSIDGRCIFPGNRLHDIVDIYLYSKQPKPINMVAQVSDQWATALSGLIDELGCDSPTLREWKGITPTPEKVVECIRELMELREKLAADEELDACCEWVSKYCPYFADFPMPEVKLRDARRPQPTLKLQALKEFEEVRKHSDLLPEILDTIEDALKSIPE